jgi:hypothetical protein
MTQNDPATVAQAYLDAWKANDWAVPRSLLADDATFEGPLASLQGADTLVEGLQGMARPPSRTSRAFPPARTA